MMPRSAAAPSLFLRTLAVHLASAAEFQPRPRERSFLSWILRTSAGLSLALGVGLALAWVLSRGLRLVLL